MRIHTELNPLPLIQAVNAAVGGTVQIVGHTVHKSHTHARGIELQLSGNGRTGGQYGNAANRSALWDEWGIALAAIFQKDMSARVAGVYESGEHFAWATGNRFLSFGPTAEMLPVTMLTMADVHVKHRWLYDGESVGGAYVVNSCTCGALTRRLISGTTWEEVNA